MPRKFCKKCDICGIDPKLVGTTFVDGATRHGPWADMCEKCFAMHGQGLGVGRGQRYSLDSGIQLEGGSSNATS